MSRAFAHLTLAVARRASHQLPENVTTLPPDRTRLEHHNSIEAIVTFSILHTSPPFSRMTKEIMECFVEVLEMVDGTRRKRSVKSL